MAENRPIRGLLDPPEQPRGLLSLGAGLSTGVPYVPYPVVLPHWGESGGTSLGWDYSVFPEGRFNRDVAGIRARMSQEAPKQWPSLPRPDGIGSFAADAPLPPAAALPEITLRDLQMYREAAYKTPWEPFVAGKLQWRPIDRDTDIRSDGYGRELLDGGPNGVHDSARNAYLQLFRKSLTSPLVALGADRPGDVLIGSPGDTLHDSLSRDRRPGNLLGYYDHNGGRRALAVPGAGMSLGDTAVHEVLHKGLRDVYQNYPLDLGFAKDHRLMPLHDRIVGGQASGQSLPALNSGAHANAENRDLMEQATIRAMQLLQQRQRRGGY